MRYLVMASMGTWRTRVRTDDWSRTLDSILTSATPEWVLVFRGDRVETYLRPAEISKRLDMHWPCDTTEATLYMDPTEATRYARGPV